MPDFERPLRQLALDMAKTPQQRAELEAYHRGKDRARREMAIVVLVAAIITVIICIAIQ